MTRRTLAPCERWGASPLDPELNLAEQDAGDGWLIMGMTSELADPLVAAGLALHVRLGNVTGFCVPARLKRTLFTLTRSVPVDYALELVLRGPRDPELREMVKRAKAFAALRTR